MSAEVQLESGLCCETKYVSYGRTGETFPCSRQAKVTTIASGPGYSLEPRPDGKTGYRAIDRYAKTQTWERGDTLHVCAVHDRMHRKRIEKSSEAASNQEQSDRNLEEANSFIKKYDIKNARPYYHATYIGSGKSGYKRAIIVDLDDLKELIDGVYRRGQANGFKLADRQRERE